MNTVLTNRLGDFFLLVRFSFYLFSTGIIDFGVFFFWFSVFIVFASFTKSAQFPFSGWLPKAMSAPTPVSSLVHRSTLVTAGLFLVFCFTCLMIRSLFLYSVFLTSFFTLTFSNVLATYERDLKKVIALSTLSQIGFCIFILVFSFVFLCFFHMISHALFKRCLFIQLGYFIYFFFGQQDIRSYLFSLVAYNFICFQFLCCLFGLCGIFFCGGMLRKDYVIELVFFFDVGFVFFLGFLLVV
jgi:NADH-ubiquinone oxidoreductase chain 5